MHPQCTSHWEVPRACYSPSLTVQSGRGQPTFKGGVNASRAHGCHVIHVYHAFEFESAMSQGVWLSLHGTCGCVKACLCPRYPKKNRPMVKKTTINQSRSIRQKSKKIKKKKSKIKLGGLVPQKKKKEVYGAWILCQSGNTLHSRVGRMT